MNFKAKITSIDFYGMDKRKVGDIVFVHLFENGDVLLFSPHTKTLPTFDVIFPSIEEAKKYATCTEKTDFDVKAAWDKMMSDRYW